MAIVKGNTTVFITSEVAAILRRERKLDHRPSLANTAEVLIREAAEARDRARRANHEHEAPNGHDLLSGRPVAASVDPSEVQSNSTTESPERQG